MKLGIYQSLSCHVFPFSFFLALQRFGRKEPQSMYFLELTDFVAHPYTLGVLSLLAQQGPARRFSENLFESLKVINAAVICLATVIEC
jgi:hypothetical protein